MQMGNCDPSSLDIVPAGDRACLIRWHGDGNPAKRVSALFRSIQSAKVSGVVDAVPGFETLLVYYDPCKIEWEELCVRLSGLEWKAGDDAPSRTIEIPVVYGGEYGPDLEIVAELAGVDTNRVIDMHTSATYVVYFLGFVPGFAYMGDLSEALRLPRMVKPRTRVPAGSVAIADRFTAVYPSESPGGWRLIGWTPVALYDIMRQPRPLLQPGDRVVFRSVSSEDARQWPTTGG